MKEDKVLHLRSALEQMSDEQLGDMLREELRQDPPDENAIKLIMGVLNAREAAYDIVTTPQIDAAWEKYQERIQSIAPRPGRAGKWLRVASVAAVLALAVTVIPQAVSAESLWERLASWTDSIFAFFSGESNDEQPEYVFQTDNPGLQQVYDAVTELGVTDPVVPMWLPEGYELVECEIVSAPGHEGVRARFADGNSELVFSADVHDQEEVFRYQKDAKKVSEFNYAGMTHFLMHNNNLHIAVWTKQNIECFISAECKEDTMRKMLKSIYVMEGK